MKKVDFKKTLVRNTVQTNRKPNLVTTSVKSKSKTNNRTLQENAPTRDNCKIDKPELQSTLKLTKNIDEIVKHKLTKSITETAKLAIDEKVFFPYFTLLLIIFNVFKVTRKVNFPYDQNIYKDLIPLEIDHCKSPTVIASRAPLPYKDKEPVLSDFSKKKIVPKYYCLPNVNIENRATTVLSNNLRLYHIIEKHDLKST